MSHNEQPPLGDEDGPITGSFPFLSFRSNDEQLWNGVPPWERSSKGHLQARILRMLCQMYGADVLRAFSTNERAEFKKRNKYAPKQYLSMYFSGKIKRNPKTSAAKDHAIAILGLPASYCPEDAHVVLDRESMGPVKKSTRKRGAGKGQARRGHPKRSGALHSEESQGEDLS